MNQTSRFKSGGSEERRGYVRTLDAVGLDIQRLEPGEVFEPDESKGESTSEQKSAWQPYVDIESLRTIDPDAALHIENLESLLRKAGESGEISSLASESPTHKVSLSGSGIAFAHNLLLQPGDTVKLGLTLFPKREYLQILAMVISVGGSSGPVSGGKHAARAVFSNIDADAREKIVQHIEFVQGEM